MKKRVITVLFYGTACWQFGVLATKTIWTSVLLQPESETLTTISSYVLFPLSFWWIWRLAIEDEQCKAAKADK